MKTKQFSKKLQLKKFTVSNLEMATTKAGAEAFPTFVGNCTTGCTDEICTVLNICIYTILKECGPAEEIIR